MEKQAYNPKTGRYFKYRVDKDGKANITQVKKHAPSKPFSNCPVRRRRGIR